MSGPSGTWATTSGGGVLSAGGVAVAVSAVVVFVNRHAIGQALGQAVAEAFLTAAVAVAVAVVAVPAVVVFLVRSNRRQAVMFAARRAAMEAVEDAAEEALALRRHQRRLAIAAASAPVIHNHVWPSADAAHAAMSRPHIPATIIADAKEIR